jgi:hypothetical protein
VKDKLLQRPTAIVLIWMSLGLLSRPAETQSYVPNKDLAIGYGAIAAGAVTLIYFSIHEGHFIKGCTVSSQSGLQLQDEGNNRTYMLLGVTAKIQPGDRIRLNGKKSTKDSSGNRNFLVQQIVKDCGHCKYSLRLHKWTDIEEQFIELARKWPPSCTQPPAIGWRLVFEREMRWEVRCLR